MKSLFNRYEAYNSAGRKVSDEIQEALDPILRKWSDEGYKVNDIQSIASDNIFNIGAIIRIERSIEIDEAKKNRSLG